MIRYVVKEKLKGKKIGRGKCSHKAIETKARRRKKCV